MQRAHLLEQLSAAKNLAREGEANIRRQKRDIVILHAAGITSPRAQQELHIYEEVQEGILSDIERILEELDKLPGEPS